MAAPNTSRPAPDAVPPSRSLPQGTEAGGGETGSGWAGRPVLLSIAIILVAVLATFSRGIGNGFVWDDVQFIIRNPFLHDLSNLPRFFLSGDAAGTGGVNPYYRPLTTASFALDYALWGDRAAGYHLTNILFHLATCIALFFIVLRVTGRSAHALVGTLFFAVHPAHSEPVGYISARADLLCAFFLLLALLGFLRFADSNRRLPLLLSLAAFSLALFSKIVAMALVPMLVLYLEWFRRTGDRRWKALGPYLAISLAFLAIRSSILEMESWGAEPLPVRFANAGIHLLHFLRNALVPVGLRVFYDLPQKTDPAAPSVIAAWAVLIGIGIAIVAEARRRPVVAFGIAWFFAALLPVCGLVTVLYPSCIADRYLYIPLLGLALAIASTWNEIVKAGLFTRFRSRVLAIFGILALASSAGTAHRLPEWRDSLTFWSAAAEDAPRSLYVKDGLGAAYMEHQRIDDAERILEEVIALKSDSVQARINLAGIEFRRGDLDKAEHHTLEVLQLEPSNPIALVHLGAIKAERGWTAESAALFREALRLAPNYTAARENLEELMRRTAGREG
ncbi:MAG TPA: glycosyltransferase family 39 protein [Candidatus Deferrimicrobiaceae bacterium]